MDLHSVSYWVTVVVILGVVLISGPIVPMAEFTSTSVVRVDTSVEPNASITVLDVPSDGFRIAPERYDSDFALHMPSATVQVDDVSGDPTLIYELAVPDLRTTAATLYFITDVNEGNVLTLDTVPSTIQEQKVNRDTYSGELSIRVRAGNGSRTIHQQNVTVTVEGRNDD
jgi:hypothetical protein